jgi:predicted negative regulator of RcsB-dependent stress response
VNVYANEQEQLEALKAWWKRNGKLVISTIIIAVVVSFSWRYFQEHHIRKLTEASVLYERMLISMANHDDNGFKQVVSDLEKNYNNTVYAGLAGLFSAKKAADEGKLDVAQQELEQVIKKGYAKSIRQMARLRSARIFITQKQPQKASELLEKVDDPAYLSAINLVKGDAYVALNQMDQARQSYQSALSEVTTTEPMYAVIQMKLENLKN